MNVFFPLRHIAGGKKQDAVFKKIHLPFRFCYGQVAISRLPGEQYLLSGEKFLFGNFIGFKFKNRHHQEQRDDDEHKAFKKLALPEIVNAEKDQVQDHQVFETPEIADL